VGALAGVPQQRYSEERIEEGLQALALHGSSNSRASRQLTGIPKPHAPRLATRAS
jgi:hypothetical protein